MNSPIIVATASFLLLAGCETQTLGEQRQQALAGVAEGVALIYPDLAEVSAGNQRARAEICMQDAIRTPGIEDLNETKQLQLVLDCYEANGWIAIRPAGSVK